VIARNERLIDEPFPLRFGSRFEARRFVAEFKRVNSDASRVNAYIFGAIDAAKSRVDGMPVGRNPKWENAPVEVRCVERIDADPFKRHLPGAYRLEIVDR